jgi:hypothetical protein
MNKVKEILKKPYIKWVIYGLITVLIVIWISTLNFCTGPSIADIIKERDMYKQQFETVSNERDKMKQEYDKKLADLSNRYIVLNKKYNELKKGMVTIEKPKTSDERIKRLHNLGVTATIRK